MSDNITSILPPTAFQNIATFFPPTPWAYSWLLRIFEWGPIFTIGMWFSDYHPCGKFSKEKGLNLNGRVGWALMESVGMAHMLYILWDFSHRYGIADLPIWNKVAAGMYILHYINRAWIGPLFVAPSMSPVGIEIFLMVCWHNWFNTAILAPWIAGYSTAIDGFPGLNTILPVNAVPSGAAKVVPWIGVAVYALGMTSNIVAERRLWRMRKEEGARRASTKGSGNKYFKVYVCPPADGLFRYSMYPHYFWEWVEWFGFVLVGTGLSSVAAGNLAGAAEVGVGVLQTPSIQLPPWVMPFAYLAQFVETTLPLAPLAYVLNFVACMPPQARRGLRWYKQKFGDEAVAGRSAIVPRVSWL